MIFRDIKKKLCSFSLDRDTELKSTAERFDITCSQTETSSLSVMNVSVATVFFQAKCWFVRAAKESNCAVIVCGSHVKRVLTIDGGVGSLLRCFS